MSKNTAMQECIEQSNKLSFHHWFMANKDRLLATERADIESAYIDGAENIEFEKAQEPYYESATDYYTQTFTQKPNTDEHGTEK